MLQGFGAFTIWNQAIRAGRNPKTGLPCIIHCSKSDGKPYKCKLLFCKTATVVLCRGVFRRAGRSGCLFLFLGIGE